MISSMNFKALPNYIKETGFLSTRIIPTTGILTTCAFVTIISTNEIRSDKVGIEISKIVWGLL